MTTWRVLRWHLAWWEILLLLPMAMAAASCAWLRDTFSDAAAPPPMRCTSRSCPGQACFPGGVCEPYGAKAKPDGGTP